MIFAVGCASTSEHEEIKTPDVSNSDDTSEDLADISNYEDHILTADESEFIFALNEIGLNWNFSERQRSFAQSMHHDARSDYNHFYLIHCPSQLIFGFINVRTGFGSIYGDNYISMMFSLYREPTEDEFIRLQQEGLLTDDEWILFWEFAGIILGEEHNISNIAVRALSYFEDFPAYEAEAYASLFEGNEEGIDYRVIFFWNPFLERYANITIELTVGLSEFYREYRAMLDW